MAEFRGDVLLFTDDDVRFGPGWLAAYQDAIRRFPDADYFGGRILPDWGQAKPRWIGDEPLPLIDGVLVWFDHGAETRPFETTEPPPFGASFAIRRRLFEKIGLFRVDLGTGGMGLGRGEETEFLMRARDTGAQGVYVGEALCFHAYDPSTPYACCALSLWNCVWQVAQCDCGPTSSRRLWRGGMVRRERDVSIVKGPRRSFSPVHYQCRDRDGHQKVARERDLIDLTWNFVQAI